jgi:hypothetical protein
MPFWILQASHVGRLVNATVEEIKQNGMRHPRAGKSLFSNPYFTMFIYVCLLKRDSLANSYFT